MLFKTHTGVFNQINKTSACAQNEHFRYHKIRLQAFQMT